MNKLKWATVGFALGAGLLSFANVGQAADYSWRASIDLAHVPEWPKERMDLTA
jgi:hypothetical protein